MTFSHAAGRRNRPGESATDGLRRKISVVHGTGDLLSNRSNLSPRLRPRHGDTPYLLRPLTGNRAVEVIQRPIVPDDPGLMRVRFIHAAGRPDVDQDLI